jgi:hypothetical protein
MPCSTKIPIPYKRRTATLHTGGQYRHSLVLGALLTLSTTMALAQVTASERRSSPPIRVSTSPPKPTIPYSWFFLHRSDERSDLPFTMVGARSFGKYNHHCTHCDHPFPVYLCVVI